jgi:polar amino acid transport system substrate-binding protein
MVTLIFVTIVATSNSSMASNQIVSLENLTYITEQYPPYNYQEDGKLQGISVEILEKMWEKLGVNLNRSVILFLPWNEGYEKTLNENNTVLFSTDRSPEREELFKWVGPMGTDRTVLLAKADRNFSISSAEDLKKIKIGAVEADRAAQILLEKGIKREDLVLELTSEPIIRKLKNGSIDAWAYGDITGLWLLQQSGENASNYKIAYVLGENNIYYAFNKETPDSFVQSFQQALDYTKVSEEDEVADYELILSKYLPGIKNTLDRSEI